MEGRIISIRRRYCNYDVLLDPKKPVFKNGIALVRGTIISEEENENGRIVWGLIDKNYNEVLYRSSPNQNIPLEKLTTDGYDIGFNRKYTNFKRISDTDFLCKNPRFSEFLDDAVDEYVHIRIEGDLTHLVILGHDLIKTPNPNVFITGYKNGYRFYYFDKMLFSKQAFSQIGPFLEHSVAGRPEPLNIAFATLIGSSGSVYIPYSTSLLDCYVYPNGDCASELFSSYSILYYKIESDWSDFDAVMAKVKIDNEITQNAIEGAPINLLKRLELSKPEGKTDKKKKKN